jgi:serine/threonine protein kinase
MNPDVLCMGCMVDTNAADICPHCGYVNNSPAESYVQLSPRTILHGKYVLGKVLGQGGFGITYLAYDCEEDRKLAIKEYFPTHISTRAQDRLTVTPISNKNRPDLDYGLNKFYEEGQALFRFQNHPNIVKIVEYFQDNGTGYIVMAYIEGHTFKEYIARAGGKITFDDSLRLLSLAMNALQDLHSAGILHRDISPDNIYVEKSGGVRVLDFGATRYALGDKSQSLSVVLKPGFAPEEQYRSRGKQGPWTDIYALGATFYRAIVGQIPPESPDRQQLDDLVPPSRLGVAIPPQSEAALLTALAVKAENRFQSIAQFREAITPSSPEPVVPRTKSKDIFLPLLVILFVLNLGFAWFAQSWSVTALLLQVALFGSTLFLFFFMWKSIQDGHARATPGKAAGLALVPVFNFFWIFQILVGFATDYNAYLDRHSIRARKLSRPLFLLCSITWVLYWLLVPFRGVVATVAIILHGTLFLPVVFKIVKGSRALTSPPIAQKPSQTKALALHCGKGEYEGKDIEIGNGEIVIGRSHLLSNLVLSSPEVSGKHLRLWRDRATADLWVEDLKSTNGTWYKESRSPDGTWIRLSGSRLLHVGDRIRVCKDAAEFEVKG